MFNARLGPKSQQNKKTIGLSGAEGPITNTRLEAEKEQEKVVSFEMGGFGLCELDCLFLCRLEVGRLRMLVRQLTQFVTIRQFPPADRSLPPLSKSKWWIPAAARVLALLSMQCNFLLCSQFDHSFPPF